MVSDPEPTTHASTESQDCLGDFSGRKEVKIAEALAKDLRRPEEPELCWW